MSGGAEKARRSHREMIAESMQHVLRSLACYAPSPLSLRVLSSPSRNFARSLPELGRRRSPQHSQQCGASSSSTASSLARASYGRRALGSRQTGPRRSEKLSATSHCEGGSKRGLPLLLSPEQQQLSAEPAACAAWAQFVSRGVRSKRLQLACAFDEPRDTCPRLGRSLSATKRNGWAIIIRSSRGAPLPTNSGSLRFIAGCAKELRRAHHQRSLRDRAEPPAAAAAAAVSACRTHRPRSYLLFFIHLRPLPACHEYGKQPQRRQPVASSADARREAFRRLPCVCPRPSASQPPISVDEERKPLAHTLHFIAIHHFRTGAHLWCCL